MKGAGARDRLLAFDAKVETEDGYGGWSVAWSQQFMAWGEVIYRRGGEEMQAAAQTATSTFKIRIPSDPASRALTGEYRMRTVDVGLPSGETGDALPGARYNLREVDALSDSAHVWVVAEAGVAI